MIETKCLTCLKSEKLRYRMAHAKTEKTIRKHQASLRAACEKCRRDEIGQ